MDLEQARSVASDPIGHSHAHLALALDVLLRELNRAEALRTLGGVPPVVDTSWATRHVPIEPPPSAADPSAPPLSRA